MKLGLALAAILGIAVTTAIVGYLGVGHVLGAIAALGWRGLGVLVAWSAIPFALLGAAWFVLTPGLSPRDLVTLVWARIVRDSAGELLPFSPLGGWLIGARAAILGGIGGDAAFATTLVDVTTELIAQVAFTAIGIGLLALRLGSGSTHTGLITAVFGGLALSGIGAAAFIAMQRSGSGLIEALARRWSPGVAMRAEVIGRALATIYERPWRVAVGVSLHFTAWVASAVGCWLALRLAGVDVSLTAVIAIESLVTAARSAVVVAPMGLGVQEAAYAVVGPLFGLGSDLAIALSLLKRARDLTIGLPALLAWQALEGRRLLANRIGTAGPRPE